MLLRTPDQITSWRERIYEVPGIATAQGICWGVPDHLSGYASNIANYPGTNGTWTTMPWSQWVATYYP